MFLVLFFKQFNRNKHIEFSRKYFQQNIFNLPSVDVFVMTAGEPVETVKETLIAAKNLKYPKVLVHVFDDGQSQELKSVCLELGVICHTRPNRGWMKKAGNLYYAYSVTSGDYALVLDADFVPHPSFLIHTVPYLQDEKIGILQTPQVFRTDKEYYKTNPFEAAGGKALEGFYSIINPARDRLNSALCVGTNALYNRKMIEATGGNALSINREDMQTGINAIKAGFRIKYLPIKLAIGDSPDTLSSYFTQQNRWCRGSIQDDSVLPPEVKLPHQLNLIQKIWYKLGGLYYIRGLVTLLLTTQTFFVIFYGSQTSRHEYILYAIPFIFIVYVLPYIMNEKLPKTADIISGVAKTYIYAFSVIQTIFKVDLDWIPTGSSKGNKKIMMFSNWLLLIDISVIIIAMMLLYLIQQESLFRDIKIYIPSLMIIYNFILHFLFYLYAHRELIYLKQQQMNNWIQEILSYRRLVFSLSIFVALVLLQASNFIPETISSLQLESIDLNFVNLDSWIQNTSVKVLGQEK
jgi:cellulose synthase/poly-beta-1,6-N-acetylglucosamine synthase-like glycosyltransferase